MAESSHDGPDASKWWEHGGQGLLTTRAARPAWRSAGPPAWDRTPQALAALPHTAPSPRSLA